MSSLYLYVLLHHKCSRPRTSILFLAKSLIPDHVQDEAEAYITRLKTSSDGTNHTSPFSCYFNTSANSNAQAALPSTVHDHEQAVLPSNSGSREGSQANANQRTPGFDNELPVFSINDYMNIDALNAEVYPQDGFGPQRSLDEGTGAAILEPIKKFSSAIFRNQAETLVMASVVADYIAWLRKAPPGGGIPNVSESPVYLGMLDNLEIRLRELCEMSQSNSTGALRELVSDLGAIAPPGGAMASGLGSLEKDLQKEAQERAEVFRSRYNPCALLSEQAHKTSE